MKELLDRYSGFREVGPDGMTYETTTEQVVVEREVNSLAAALLEDIAGNGVIAVVFDKNTHRVCGRDLTKRLNRRGVAFESLMLEPHEGEDDVLCDEETISAVESWLKELAPVHAVAVGAGTINDCVKMASHRNELRYTSIGTAPSMNGYTSAIAAILSDGVKTTQPCDAPQFVFADPEIMARAPYRMIASGIGDLYSKPVSNADWRLSHRLLGTPHSTVVMRIVDAASGLLDGVAPHLPDRDVDAVAKLTGAIMLSGLAMQAAGNSSPASGGEHLISHYIDMTAHAFGESNDFHGCQVAVGTITTSTLYEQIAELDRAQLGPAIDHLVAQHLPWDEHRSLLTERFGPLAPSVEVHAEGSYPDRDELRRRLTTLSDDWDEILADVQSTLRPTKELESELRSANCPTRFAEIGVHKERARKAIAHSKDIRARYTILHLAAELDLLDAFATEYVQIHG